jgi:hypothetical protein
MKTYLKAIYTAMFGHIETDAEYHKSHVREWLEVGEIINNLKEN